MDISTETSPDSPEAEAIRLMGGPVATARELGIDNYQTVQSWVKNGIPARYCPRIENLTGVTRKALRPIDWIDYWPEFVEPEVKTFPDSQPASL
ncbi:MAG: YdaS family helix-turn-helix protein [Variovorax sp.]